jgi:hypothetical protein
MPDRGLGYYPLFRFTRGGSVAMPPPRRCGLYDKHRRRLGDPDHSVQYLDGHGGFALLREQLRARSFGPMIAL